MGFNTKGRGEAAVYVARTFLKNNRNSFNSVERDKMLKEIKVKTPAKLVFCSNAIQHQLYYFLVVKLFHQKSEHSREPLVVQWPSA